MHCHQGADRTGMASVLYELLHTGATLQEARRRLGPSSGHLPLGRTGWIDCFFDLYQSWLTETAQEHSRDVFLSWVNEHYCPAEGRARFEVLDPAPGPDGLLRTSKFVPRQLTVRCHNDSPLPWQFKTQFLAGMHLVFHLVDEQERTWAFDMMGRFDRTVAPGGFVDLAVPLPALPPGRFQLRLDLSLTQHATFLQLGNDLLVVNLEAL
jgi:hypothetical protein